MTSKLIEYQAMWLILLAIMVWIPLLVMSGAFIIIWFKLRQSFKAFPYLSYQSNNARSRGKAIKMLLFLIIIELICWAPWAFFIVCEYIIHEYYTLPHVLNNPFPMVNTFKYA